MSEPVIRLRSFWTHPSTRGTSCNILRTVSSRASSCCPSPTRPACTCSKSSHRTARRMLGPQASPVISTKHYVIRFTKVLGNSIWKCLFVNYVVQFDAEGQSKLLPGYSEWMNEWGVMNLVGLFKVQRRQGVWWKPLVSISDAKNNAPSPYIAFDLTTKLYTPGHIHYALKLRLLIKKLF